jgi:hypothetical protein
VKIDLKVLQARHPQEYAAVLAAGVAQERDRVAALLHAGTVTGATDLAISAIRSGADLDAKLSAEFLERGMCRRDQQARLEDEYEVSLAADGVANTNIAVGKSPADLVADMVCEGFKSGDIDREARNVRVGAAQ